MKMINIIKKLKEEGYKVTSAKFNNFRYAIKVNDTFIASHEIICGLECLVEIFRYEDVKKAIERRVPSMNEYFGIKRPNTIIKKSRKIGNAVA